MACATCEEIAWACACIWEVLSASKPTLGVIAVGWDIGDIMPSCGVMMEGVTAGGGGISPFLEDFGVELPEGIEMLYGIGAGASPPDE